MTLTYDTLLHIISVSLNVQDTMQLIATCRVLYHEGPKVALKKVVTIYTEEQLASFLKFLRADNSSRCRYLRQLELCGCFLEPDVVQELIDTIPLLTNIEYLGLKEAEDLLELDPALTVAFSAITSLRHIEFTGVQGESYEILSTLQSPLISANVSFLTMCDWGFWDFVDIGLREAYHPVTVLGKFSLTLEELQCTAWFTPSDKIVPEDVYPNMRKLSIGFHEFPLRIDPFIRAFPNLTHLHVNTDGSYSEGIRESHDTNVVQQLDPVDSCGTWMHLDHFSGCLSDLYAIGLTFHIPHITIMDRLDNGPKTDMLATVLGYARPVRLKLEGITSSMLGDSDRGFISMLQSGSSAHLINLDVCIYFGEDDREKDLGAVVVRSSMPRCNFQTHQRFDRAGQSRLRVGWSSPQVPRVEVRGRWP